MRHMKLRILVNGLAALAIAFSWLLLRRKGIVTRFDTATGVAEYKETWYVLWFVPVYWKKKSSPILRGYGSSTGSSEE